jgi:hypothetical protein
MPDGRPEVSSAGRACSPAAGVLARLPRKTPKLSDDRNARRARQSPNAAWSRGHTIRFASGRVPEPLFLLERFAPRSEWSAHRDAPRSLRAASRSPENRSTKPSPAPDSNRRPLPYHDGASATFRLSHDERDRHLASGDDAYGSSGESARERSCALFGRVMFPRCSPPSGRRSGLARLRLV